jgi:hypothetical protein
MVHNSKRYMRKKTAIWYDKHTFFANLQIPTIAFVRGGYETAIHVMTDDRCKQQTLFLRKGKCGPCLDKRRYFVLFVLELLTTC